MSKDMKDQLLDLFPVYQSKINSGEYYIPPILLISDMLINRYGEDRVSYPRNRGLYVENITIDNLNTIESFTSIIQYLTAFPDDIYIESSIYSNDFLKKIQIDFSFEFLIYYPKIEITNSLNLKHTIQDLYVKLHIDSEGKFTNNFSINRGKYTESEILAEYKHSHANSDLRSFSDFRSFSNVCLGDTLLKTLVSNMSNFPFNELNYSKFLMLLDDFLYWESLEGVPFKQIKHIQHPKWIKLSKEELFSNLFESTYIEKSIINAISIENIKNVILEHIEFYPGIKMETLDPYIEGKYDLLKIANALKEPIKEHIKTRFGESRMDDIIEHDLNYKCILNSFGEYDVYRFKYGSRNIDNFDFVGEPLFVFKGTPVLLDIIEAEENDIIEASDWVIAAPTIQKLIIYIIDYINDEYIKLKTVSEI